MIRLAIALAAVITPAVALAGWRLSRARGFSIRAPVWGAVAAAGPLVAILWMIYNYVVGVFELDSLTGLAVHFIIFTAIGVIAGWVWSRFVSPSMEGGAEHLRLGRQGEALAAQYLKRAGLRIVGRNVRRRDWEIDLIAGEGETVVFVEVKTRRSSQYGEPETAVDERKREKIRAGARQYLRRFCRSGERPPCRFDIVAVEWPTTGEAPVVRHSKAAFSWQESAFAA